MFKRKNESKADFTVFSGCHKLITYYFYSYQKIHLSMSQFNSKLYKELLCEMLVIEKLKFIRWSFKSTIQKLIRFKNGYIINCVCVEWC